MAEQRRAVRRRERAAFALLAASLAGALGSAFAGCHGWSPERPFERNAPEVDEALDLLDGGQFDSAEKALRHYLEMGRCEAGKIAIPLDRIRDRHNGSFDLGLTLFYLAEQFGRRFGEEESDAGAPRDDPEQRGAHVDCGLLIVREIAADTHVPLDLRARALYLAGNLEFLRRRYKQAVEHYDGALALIPGLEGDAGDPVGRDAAWNRAIALQRLQKQQEQDAGADAQDEQDASPDGGDGGDDPDGGDGGDGGGGGGRDGGADGGGEPDDPNDPNEPDDPNDPNQQKPQDPNGQQPKPQDPNGQQPKPQDPNGRDPGGGRDEGNADPDGRLLDDLDGARPYQAEEAKGRQGGPRRRDMEDK